MKTILSIFAIACSLQLSAQLTALPGSKENTNKNNFTIQVNTSDGLALNYERFLLQKGKYSLLGQVGISSQMPFISKNFVEGGKAIVTLPILFGVNVGIVNRWDINKKHSIQFSAGIRRFQFYKPDAYKDVFNVQEGNQMSKYLELEYRFQSENSKWFFTSGYRHTFGGLLQENYGVLKFGVGFEF